MASTSQKTYFFLGFESSLSKKTALKNGLKNGSKKAKAVLALT